MEAATPKIWEWWEHKISSCTVTALYLSSCILSQKPKVCINIFRQPACAENVNFLLARIRLLCYTFGVISSLSSFPKRCTCKHAQWSPSTMPSWLPHGKNPACKSTAETVTNAPCNSTRCSNHTSKSHEGLLPLSIQGCMVCSHLHSYPCLTQGDSSILNCLTPVIGMGK